MINHELTESGRDFVEDAIRRSLRVHTSVSPTSTTTYSLTGIAAHGATVTAQTTVHVAADAVCSRDAANARTGLELLRDAGAAVTCTETAIFQLLGRDGTEEFKAALPLVK